MRPLVSVIVVLDADEQAAAGRIADVKSQDWPDLEVIVVATDERMQGAPGVTVTAGNRAAAINAGVAASRGEYISLHLPGVHYVPDKVSRQVRFMEAFELQQAVIFCNHAVRGGGGRADSEVVLRGVDPWDMFRALYCGLPLQFCSALFPRRAFADCGPLDTTAPQAALHGFVLQLSRRMPFVGMADTLLRVDAASPGGPARRELRRLYARLLPAVLDDLPGGARHLARLACLGEAMSARLSDGLPMAALDVLRRAFDDGCRWVFEPASLRALFGPSMRLAFRRLPARVRASLRRGRRPRNAVAHGRLDFQSIYRDNGFGANESRSGAGSTRFQTRIIRRELPMLLQQLGARSLLDIPCGDFHWMSEVALTGIDYTGADVVQDMVDANRRRYGAAGRTFVRVDLVAGPLPPSDVVFCRDCLVHLPFEDALSAIATICDSPCEWLLMTTFTRGDPNRELDDEGWRPLNLTLPPFNFPPPERMIVEKCTEAGGRAGDKVLGLWRIADLPRPVRP